MKLATLREGTRDGALVVVNRAMTLMVKAKPEMTLQSALDRWEQVEPQMRATAERLERGEADDALPFDLQLLDAPMPRSYGWLDGTSYLSHMVRARELRGAAMPPGIDGEPAMGERTGLFLAATDPLPLFEGDMGMDIEGEVGVILGDVPAGAGIEECRRAIRLITLVNDVSLRTVLAETAARGRSATLAAKPWPTQAPVAVTPDELGDAWDGDLLRLKLHCHLNGELFAAPDASIEASFTYPELISYCARYRPLPAGTVLAAGTISNSDDDVGGACIAERRCIEKRRLGAPVTEYLAVGDHVRIEMFDVSGASIFGAIDQRVIAY